eukprot:2896397-Amphidinium_carterae.1
MDYLFYCSQLETDKQKVILHVIDVATRYTQAILLPDKSEQALRSGLSRSWIAVFGTPKCIVVDEETSAHSMGSAEWAEYVGTQLAFKAPRQEAWIIERHNALLRETLHRMESQCNSEGRHPPFEDVLSLAISSKNSLTSYQGFTPQQAVFGRNSTLLPAITSVSAEGDQTDGQQHQRLRELAVAAITEVHSKERIRRAHRHHTTATLTDASYPKGTAVDIWFEPTNKDITGWKGPAEVQLCQPERGQVTVKWQGRILDRRAAEIRPHVVYLLDDSSLLPLADSWTCLRTTLEALPSPSTQTVGHVYDSQANAWKVETMQNKTLGHLMLALLDIHVSYLGFPYPTAMRWTRGLPSMPHLTEYQACEVWAWTQGSRHIEAQMWLDSDEVIRLKDEQLSVPSLPLRHWGIELSRQSGASGEKWIDVHFLQWWHSPHEKNETTPSMPPLLEELQTQQPPTQPHTSAITNKEVKTEAAEPLPLEAQVQDTPMPPPDPNTSARSRSRSMDRTGDRTWDMDQTGGQPPPQPPDLGSTPVQHLDQQPRREISQDMSRSRTSSGVTDRTRSRGAPSEMSIQDQGGGKPPGPPPSNAAPAPRGRALARQPATRNAQYDPPAPSAVPPNHIDTMEVLDLMGLPVPEQEPSIEMDRTSSRDTRSRSSRGPTAIGSMGVQPSDTTMPQSPATENEQLVTRPPTPASTVNYSPSRSVTGDDTEEFVPQLPLEQPAHPDDDDDDEDPAPPGASAAASTGNAAQKRSLSEEKGGDNKKHRPDKEDEPFITVPTRLLTRPSASHQTLTPQWTNLHILSSGVAGSQAPFPDYAVSTTTLITLLATSSGLSDQFSFPLCQAWSAGDNVNRSQQSTRLVDGSTPDPCQLLSTEAASLSID